MSELTDNKQMNTHKEPKQMNNELVCPQCNISHCEHCHCTKCQPSKEELILSADYYRKAQTMKLREEQPKNRSFFDMSDEEKKEIVDKAAEDSNKAQRKLMEEQPKDDFEESNLDYTKWTPTGESSVKLTVNKSQSWEEEFNDRFTANNAKMSRKETMLFEPTTTFIKQFIQSQINLAVQKEKEQLTKKIIKFDKQKRRTVMKADSQPKKVLYIWCQAQEEFTQDIIAIINNKKEEES